MIVYLVRHGIAEEQSASGADEDRRLTDAGRKRVKQIAAGLQRLGVSPSAIFASPLPRAAETARLIAARLGAAPRLEIARRLQPAVADARSARSLLADLAEARSSEVMIVGHEPSLSAMIGDLAGRGTAVLFKKGGVCRIDLQDAKAAGELIWLLPPKVLAALGRE
ncbi:MAG TPA: phosphohistidine phosphatase SixA [Herpetosiphonaceae bacterium]